jgi:hypothetical protein
MSNALAPYTPNATAKLYADVLITAHGSVELAVEVLNKGLAAESPQRVGVAKVLSEMAANPQELARVGVALRTQAILRLFQMQATAHDELVTVLTSSELEPADVSRLYSSLTHEIMTATQHTTNIQIISDDAAEDEHYKNFLERLPPEVRRAVISAADVVNSTSFVASQNGHALQNRES